MTLATVTTVLPGRRLAARPEFAKNLAKAAWNAACLVTSNSPLSSRDVASLDESATEIIVIQAESP